MPQCTVEQGSDTQVLVSILPVQRNAFCNLPGCCYRPWFSPLKKHVGARVIFSLECSFDNLVQTVLVHVINHTVSFIHDLKPQGRKRPFVKYWELLFPLVFVTSETEGKIMEADSQENCFPCPSLLQVCKSLREKGKWVDAWVSRVGIKHLIL